MASETMMTEAFDVERVALSRFFSLKPGESPDLLTSSVISSMLDRVAGLLLESCLSLLTIDEATKFLGVDAKTLAELSITHEGLRPMMLGGRPVWRRAALQEYIDSLPTIPQ